MNTDCNLSPRLELFRRLSRLPKLLLAFGMLPYALAPFVFALALKNKKVLQVIVDGMRGAVKRLAGDLRLKYEYPKRIHVELPVSAMALSRGFIIFLLSVACAFGVGPVFAQVPGEKISAEALAAIEAAFDRGESKDVLVTYDAAAVRAQAKQSRLDRRLPTNDDDVLREKARGYAQTKAAVASALGASSPRVLRSYGQLPVEYVLLETRESLSGLLADVRVAGVALPQAHARQLVQSLQLINQPGAAQQGMRGAGTAVAVLDTGVDYTRSAFGSCAAPGPGCKVVYARDFAPEDGVKDADGHGTNVAAIVLGVAPDSAIIALDVFRSDVLAYTPDVVAAINWTIENRTRYNIVAINMSLGGGKYTVPVTNSGDAYKNAIDDARAAGMVVVVAAGNDAFTNALASPAAVDTALSVGAVYDSAMGTMDWGKCIDFTTLADKVTCFSNSASFLTMLAPGALITAAGVIQGGTSQAAPHVAGAAAVLRSAYPTESVNQTISRLLTGVQVLDARNQITKSRLNLLQALSLDLVPDPFQFIDQISAPAGAQITSNTVAISGINGRASISISPPGQYSVNGGAFVTETRSVASGDLIQGRITSSSTPGAVASTTLTVGGISDTFSVTTSATAALPAVQFSPGVLAFGAVGIAAAATQSVTLSNTGAATLNSIAVAVTSGQDFSIISNSCGISLTAGQSCIISVRFSPTVPVARSATLSVSSNASGSPHTVPLTGVGTSLVSLSEAVDSPGLSFSSSGNASWFGQTSIAYFGGDAARSGVIGDFQSTYMETAVTGPGSISFRWKVSSEPNYDYLRFYIGGVEIASVSGEVDWSIKTYSLGAGSHTLRWTYSKDSSVSSGTDAAWVDLVSFTPGQPSLSLSAASQDFGSVAVGASASRTLVVTNTGAAALSIGPVAMSGQSFSKGADTCSNASVSPSASCSVTISFTPATTGARTGAITIPSNAAGSPHVVTLSGSGAAQSGLGAAVDNTSLSFTTGASVPWFSQSAVTRLAGNNTAQSGPAGDLQVSYMETTVTGPGRLSFYWKVSSEAFFDRLALMVDGVTQGWTSGEFNWEERFYDIGSGAHTIRWAYIKTAELPSGVDAGWVDQVSFQPLSAPVNLSEALDAPSQAWRTIGIPGSSAPWSGQSAVAIFGGDAAESPPIANDQSSTLRTIVKGPGTVSFKWKVSSEDNYDFLCFYKDFSGTPTDCISGEVDWTSRNFSIPPGVWGLDWIYSKDSSFSAGFDRGWVDQMVFTPTDVALSQAVDNVALTFETNPTAPWYGQGAIGFVGANAAQSPPIDDGQRTWLQTSVTGPGEFSFYWKVSSEQGYDFLRFYLDDAEVTGVPAISGEVNWTQRTVPIGPGTHVITWAYGKDFYCCSVGLDAAWVDGIVFTQTQADTQAPTVPGGLTATVVSSAQINLSWTASTDAVGVNAYKIYRGGVLIQTLGGGILSYADAGLAASTSYSYTVQACDAAGNCSAQSPSVLATTQAPPDTQAPTVPSGLTTTAVSSSQINVSWSATTDNIGVAQYKVYRGGSLLTTLTGTPPVTSYSNTGLTASTLYSYTVQACDAAGNCSAQSASASATTLTVPGAPTIGAATGGSAQATVSFTAPTNTGGSPITGYTASCSAASQTPMTGTGAASPITVAGLTNGIAYTCSVKATNSVGPGASSAASNSVTPSELTSYTPVLKRGWNLLGNSLNTPLSVATVFGSSTALITGVTDKLNSVWKWNASTGRWQFYAPTISATDNQTYATANGFTVLTTIEPGAGYWVNVKNDAPLTGVTLAAQTGALVVYEPRSDIPPVTPARIAGRDIVTGWNLVAIADPLAPREFNEGLSGTPPSPGTVKLSFVSLWAWDVERGRWFFYSTQLEKDGVALDQGLALVKQYAINNGFLHFEDTSKTLGVGVGFWMRK